MNTKIATRKYIIICDDVRREEGNKMSFMGVYPKDIVVEKFPVIMPTLHFIAVFEDTKVALPGVVSILKLPKTKPMSLELPVLPQKAEGSTVNLVMGLASLKIENEGLAKIEIRSLEDKKLFVSRKFLIKKKQ